jgi:hypothetical protein
MPNIDSVALAMVFAAALLLAAGSRLAVAIYRRRVGADASNAKSLEVERSVGSGTQVGGTKATLADYTLPTSGKVPSTRSAS